MLRELLGGSGGPGIVQGWAEFSQGSQRLALAVAPLENGFVLGRRGIAVIPEAAILGDRPRQARRRRRAERDPDTLIRALTDLNLGAAVVHQEHGVGRYLGLCTLEAGGQKGEFLTLEYAGGDKLYVPVQSLDLISRYTGTSPESAPLHRLGSDQWTRARKRAAARVRDVAAELLDIHARRAARPGHAFRLDARDYAAFCEAFPFEETADQRAAIAAVVGDMTQGRPMDRVVCGDVGFGKTEVAMRAAFVAANGGKQVAVLVPTTLLAQQHFQNFSDRFADWPVRVELLSRFRSKKEADRVLGGLADGTVDIVIGTHKLLARDVRFADLGLLIVDEEHRFGVRDKERLKALRADVDMLTLTATPIPRTLNMAMGGLRDLSLITTPPEDRLAVKTFVTEWNAGLVREAFLREIRRGGQVYFLHNKVETIERTASGLEELVPEARVRIAHGQMRERELEQIMLDFYHRRFNVLVCTTIIESGIDVPTANTIVINRADKLGLAQLHQLRGRVGRSHHRAYAYLVTPPAKAMTPDAVKRLEAIESLEALGAGFMLATHDLEIRGAGELLGQEQSGQIQEIGFSLYMEMLQRAVSALQSGREPALEAPLNPGVEVEMGTAALLPEDYVPDVHMRLVLYKRIAAAEDAETLRDLQVELIDRFGLLPDPAKQLFMVSEIRQRARQLGIQRLDANAAGGRVQFASETNVQPEALIRLIQDDPRRFRLDGQSLLRFSGDLGAEDRRFRFVHRMLDRLAEAA
jgi:transcription-repair coupling factor (superfamily II helicase)